MIHSSKILSDAILDFDTDGDHYSTNANTKGFNFRSPLCINTFRYDLYNPDWDIQRILVFEGLIAYTFKYGNGFYKPIKKMTKELRQAKYTIQKEIKYLKKNKYLRVEKMSKEQNYKNLYMVNYIEICENLDSIYNFKAFGNKDRARYMKEMYDNMFSTYHNKTDKSEDRYDEFSTLIFKYGIE